MTRWEPNARGRLEVAALELYREHGYEQTTVAEIAGRAGLSERTFFRHFADKREVLFHGSRALQELLVGALEAVPRSATPIDAMATAMGAAAPLLQDRWAQARQRQEVIAANPELLEREVVKMATLSVALAETLRGRGVGEPAASLTADAGISVFRVAFALWVGGAVDQGLASVMQESFAQLKAVAAGR